MKEIHLASYAFIDWDVSDACDYLCAVRVTNDCYDRLKKEDYVLYYDNMRCYLKNRRASTRSDKFYGGETGFTYEELMTNYRMMTICKNSDFEG